MALELFATTTCPYCSELREQLDADGLDYVEYDVEADAAARARLNALVGGQRPRAGARRGRPRDADRRCGTRLLCRRRLNPAGARRCACGSRASFRASASGRSCTGSRRSTASPVGCATRATACTLRPKDARTRWRASPARCAATLRRPRASPGSRSSRPSPRGSAASRSAPAPRRLARPRASRPTWRPARIVCASCSTATIAASATRTSTARIAARATASSTSCRTTARDTTMRAWPLCAACRAEYEDPANRRFHAAAGRVPGVRAARALGIRRRTRSRGEAARARPPRCCARGAIVAIKGHRRLSSGLRCGERGCRRRAARAQVPQGTARLR